MPADPSVTVVVYDLLSGASRSGVLSLSQQGDQVGTFLGWPRSFGWNRRLGAILTTDIGSASATWVGLRTVEVTRRSDHPRRAVASVSFATTFPVILHRLRVRTPAHPPSADLLDAARQAYPALTTDPASPILAPPLPHPDAFDIPDVIETLLGTSDHGEIKICQILHLC